MRGILTLIIFFLGFIQSGVGQSLSGNIVDDKKQPLSGVTLLLFSSKDSLNPAKITVSSNTGDFTIQNILPGSYYLKLSRVNFKDKLVTEVFISSSKQEIPTIVMEPVDEILDEVTVTATRPMMEVKNDKIVLNVDGTINAVGNDAIELLRKSPGVMVDKDDNISLNGKTGVVVYIDGRPSQLSGADLSSYLRTLQSAQIDAIEIISNPSAKYDAAGNAGVINIKLKKNKSFGTNVSMNAGYGIAVYPKYNAGFSLNSRSKSANFFASANAYSNKTWVNLQFDRFTLDSVFKQKTVIANDAEGVNYKAGVDFFLNNKSTLGVMVNGITNESLLSNDNYTDILDKNLIYNRFLAANNNSENNRNNINANLNYTYSDTMGRVLNLDFDFGRHYNKSYQYQPNIYYTPDRITELSRIVYEMNVANDINLYATKVDFETNWLKGKFSTGSKFTIVDSDNDFKRYDVEGSTSIFDPQSSNDFQYDESIFALYADYVRNFKHFSIQTGLRTEHTSTKGVSYEYAINGNPRNMKYSFKRSYFDFFPTVNLNFTKNPNHHYRINYERRIDRPVYQDLNPFEFKIDEYTFNKGNPDLLPQYSDKITFGYTYKYKLNLALNYTHVSNVFAQLVDTVGDSKSFIGKKNLADQNVVSLSATYPFQHKRYSMMASLNTFYSMYKGQFGLNRDFELNVFTLSAYIHQSYKLSSVYNLDMSLWGTTASVWQGTFKSDPMGMMDIGVSRSLFKNRGNLRVVVTDVLKTLDWKGTSNFAGQKLYATGTFESRQLKLNFTWRFGNAQVRSARNRNSGLEDEQKRVNAEGGGIGQ